MPGNLTQVDRMQEKHPLLCAIAVAIAHLGLLSSESRSAVLAGKAPKSQ